MNADERSKLRRLARQLRLLPSERGRLRKPPPPPPAPEPVPRPAADAPAP